MKASRRGRGRALSDGDARLHRSMAQRGSARHSRKTCAARRGASEGGRPGARAAGAARRRGLRAARAEPGAGAAAAALGLSTLPGGIHFRFDAARGPQIMRQVASGLQIEQARLAREAAQSQKGGSTQKGSPSQARRRCLRVREPGRGAPELRGRRLRGGGRPAGGLV